MRSSIRVQVLFLLLVAGGTALPLNYLFRFLASEGLNLSLFFRQLFDNNVSALFAMDVLISAMVLWVFVFVEGRRLKMKNLWGYVACTVLIGVSLALPLFLFFRERQLSRFTIEP